MTIKIANNEDHPTEIYPRNTRNTAVWVHGVRSVPKSYTVPEPVLPVLETPWVSPYPCGTLFDLDFFSAVCNCLRPKMAQLIHLELGSPGLTAAQDRLRYDSGQGCWSLFKNVSQPGLRSFQLESLLTHLPAGKANFGIHYSWLIPRSVMRLSLPGHDLLHNSFCQIFKVVSLGLSSHDIYWFVHYSLSAREDTPAGLQTSILFAFISILIHGLEFQIDKSACKLNSNYPIGEDYEFLLKCSPLLVNSLSRYT